MRENDPNFTAKAADVVGLYVAPPEKAIVFCVDEKPSIQALHSKRRRRLEFLGFMDSVTSAFPDRHLHVILEISTPIRRTSTGSRPTPNVKFHFMPTSASWLNQVEVWFSILQGQSLSGASFTSLKQLQEHIDAYINAYNEKAEPFVWTKKKVRQRRFKGRRITQL